MKILPTIFCLPSIFASCDDLMNIVWLKTNFEWERLLNERELCNELELEHHVLSYLTEKEKIDSLCQIETTIIFENNETRLAIYNEWKQINNFTYFCK